MKIFLHFEQNELTFGQHQESDEDLEIEEYNGPSDLSNTIRMMMKDDIDYFGQDADENLPDEE